MSGELTDGIMNLPIHHRSENGFVMSMFVAMADGAAF